MNNETNIFYLSDSWKIVKKYYKKIVRNILIVSVIVFGYSFLVNKTTVDLRVDLLKSEDLIYEDEYINLESISKKMEFSKIYLDELEESLKYDKQDGDIVRELLDEINGFRVQYNEWKKEMSSLISVPYIEKDSFYNKIHQSTNEYLRRIQSTEIMIELIDEFGEEYLENTEDNRFLSILESINNLPINEKYYNDYSKIEDKILTYTKEEWDIEYQQFIQQLENKVDEYNELINSLNGKIIDIAKRNRLEIRTDIKSVNGKEEYQVIVIPMDMPENRTQLLLSMEVLGFCFTIILSILYYSKVENDKYKKNII